jgi:hypothetical protein
MGKWKRDGNHSTPKNSEENEKKGYPDPDSNKTNVNYTKETNKAHKKILQEEMLQVINENFIEMLLDMVNQNVQETLKKLYTTTN